jgi:hypothetical protein
VDKHLKVDFWVDLVGPGYCEVEPTQRLHIVILETDIGDRMDSYCYNRGKLALSMNSLCVINAFIAPYMVSITLLVVA